MFVTGAGVAVKLVVPATVPTATVAFKVGALVGCVIVGEPHPFEVTGFCLEITKRF